MTIRAQEPGNRGNGVSKAIHTAERDVKPVQAFITKFNNDWSMNMAAALAYNLMMAIVPIAIGLLAILGLVIGTLNPQVYAHLKDQIVSVFPSATNARTLLDTAFNQFAKSAGFLGIVAIILALFNGSRLFILIEGCFDIIYHVRPRKVIAQNAMAFLMLLLFILLIPVMVLAASGPALIFSLLQNTSLGLIPGARFLFSLGGILGGLIAAYILFQVIYIVVPNQKVSFRNSWRGAVVTAILLQLYLTLFPLYVAHFLTGYGGQALGLIILLIFFYYFAVILFLGAEINAFFAEGIRVTPYDLVTLVHIMTGHQATSEREVKQEAPPSHKDEPPKEIIPKDGQSGLTVTPERAQQ